MKEKAKKILLKLKGQNKVLSDSFDDYVSSIVKELEIPKDIAITLVTSELVNKYHRDLILHELFSNATLKNLDKK